jgi:hypothetical protein
MLSLKSSEPSDSASIYTQDGFDSLETEFDFDDQIISTNMYRAAFKSHLRTATSNCTAPSSEVTIKDAVTVCTFGKVIDNDLGKSGEGHISPRDLVLFNNTEISAHTEESKDPVLRRYSASSVANTKGWNQGTRLREIVVQRSVAVNFPPNHVQPSVWSQTKASHSVFRMSTLTTSTHPLTLSSAPNISWRKNSLVTSGTTNTENFPTSSPATSSLPLCSVTSLLNR